MIKHYAAINKEQIIEGTLHEVARALNTTKNKIYDRACRGQKSLLKGYKIVEAWQVEWRCYDRKSFELLATAETAKELSEKMYYSHSWAQTIKAMDNSKFYKVTTAKIYTPEYYEAVRVYHDSERLTDEELDEIAKEVNNEYRKNVV